MKKIVRFAVKYPVTVLMITLAFCLLGVISYNRLGTDLFPDLKNPSLYVELNCGERPPEEVERQYAERIESVAARQDGVKGVYTLCKVGYAKVTVEYSWKQDMDAAFLDLQRNLSSFSQMDGVEELNVTRYDANADPMMTIAFTHAGTTDMNELRKIAENFMRNELIRLPGIADIQLNGQEEACVEIRTDGYMMDAFNLTASQVASSIESLNRNVSGGTITDNNIQYTVKGVSLLNTLSDIENIIVAFNSQSAGSSPAPVYLKDIASISINNKDPENMARFNGERCLGISVYKENKYNTVDAVENLMEKIDEFRKTMPDYNFYVINNQGDYIRESVNEVADAAWMGILLAVIVLFIFLRRWKVTLIVSLAIPVSILTAFNMIYFGGLSINLMTLGGLALGVGMMLDSAIVVVENIFRHMEEKGEAPDEAAILGTSEVGGAITASVITTIVVFLPIVYLQGAAGELFREQAWTITFALLASLFAAIFLIPMMAARYLKPRINKTGEVVKPHESITLKGYGRFLSRLVDHRWVVIIVALLVTVGAYFLMPFIGVEFMPKADSKEFTVSVTMAPGLRLVGTDDAVASIEESIHEFGGENIEWVYTLVGPSSVERTSTQNEEDNQAQITVKLKEKSQLEANDFIAFLSDTYDTVDGVEFSYSKNETALNTVLGTEEAPLVVEVKGEELELLDELCTEIMQRLHEVPGLYDIKSSMEHGAPEVDITIDRIKSGIYGVNIASVASQVEQRLSGTTAGSYENNGESVDIVIRVPEVELADIYNLEITQGSNKYRLSEIATLSITSAPKEIHRNNQNRIGRVTALIESGYSLGHVTPNVQAIIDQVEFPARYSASITGEEALRSESFEGLWLALLLSLLLVYMVMAAQFESLRHPFTILLTIPLAGVGCIITFLLFNQTFNMMAFIGVIMLAGIAVNSSIILVDAINRLKAEGYALKEAIVTAGQQRIRPILMTSITTILALLPMCVGFGDGASLRTPMAFAVVGGLISATVMTLVVIPCVYYVVDKKKK